MTKESKAGIFHFPTFRNSYERQLVHPIDPVATCYGNGLTLTFKNMNKLSKFLLMLFAQGRGKPVRWKERSTLLLLFLSLCILPAMGQNYIDFDFEANGLTGIHNVTNNSSDYTLVVSWSSVPSATSSIWGTPCSHDGVGLDRVQYGTTVNNTTSQYTSPVFNFKLPNGATALGPETIIVGPDFNQNLHWWIEVDGASGPNNGGPDCNQYENSEAPANGIPRLNFRTAALKPPVNVTASNSLAQGSGFNEIVLTWNKGTDVPDSLITYRIHRRLAGSGAPSVFVADVNSSTLAWTDTNVLPGTAYEYFVRTILNASGEAKWGQKISADIVVTGSTLDPAVSATDGVYKNRITTTWNSLASVVENIRISRSFPNSTTSFEELAILNKNATTYSDYNAIPGVQYTYEITALDQFGNNLWIFTDLGHMKPNGVIKGRVISTGGAGVANVAVTISPTSSFTGPSQPATGVSAGPYTQLTDVGGYYEIRDIYYFDDATFEITPTLSGHDFDPDSLVRTLDLNTTVQSGVNFTDLTALTVGGMVSFSSPANYGATGPGCAVEGASILIDGIDFGIKTQADGSWSYSLTDSNTYVFQAEYLHHQFDLDSIVRNVGADMTDIDFVNIQEDSIAIRVQGGCNTSVSSPTPFEPLQVQVSSVDPGCFVGTYTTNANGYIMVPLPATAFNVNVVNNNLDPNAWAQFQDTTMRLDLSLRDSANVISYDTTLSITPAQIIILGGDTTIIPADTLVTFGVDTLFQSQQPSADFIYLRPFEVSIDFDQTGAEVLTSCYNALPGGVLENIILFDQGARYPLQIEIVEQGTACPVEKGRVKVYDYISDREQSPVEVSIQNGHAFYEVNAGSPVLAAAGNHPHQKLLYLVVNAGTRPAQAEDFWGLVQGADNLSPTFSTRSPELPDLILHDPPGDASYAMVEAGSSFKSFVNEAYESSGSGGIYSDQTYGSALLTSFTEIKTGVQWKVEFNAGRDNFDKTGYSNTLTFTDTYSTSDDAIFTGNDGDVYIGKATNQQFSIAKVLTYDSNVCTATVSDEPALQVTGIATTFIYTEKHIRDILIPQLEYLQEVLRETATGPDSLLNIHEADSFAIDVFNWNSILLANESNRNANASFVENLSFSAGAAFDRTEVREETFGGSYDYIRFVDQATSIGGKFVAEGGGWSDNTVGIAAKYRYSYAKDEGNDTTLTRTVSYHLADNDFGDFFSVDILRDEAYDVPAFRVFSGTSSCPHEPGTQPRDSADIVITPPQRDNVPIGGQAVFTAQMSNYSASQETREYHVRVVSNSNPDGAIVKLNGQLINQNRASFFIDAFQTATALLTIEQGPLASNYADIGIMMYPPCEYELWENNGAITSGDTAWITVNFETECSNVALLNPGNNWLVNQNDNDLLTVDFGGYDLNNPYLESLSLQYRPAGEGWVDGPIIPKDSISTAIYRITFDVSGLSDGGYSLRAVSRCSAGRGLTYSSAVSGNIDRSSVAPFGIPSPGDGFLRLGQEISITFDKDIDCNFGSYASDSISLVRADNGLAIPFIAQCSGDKIILAPVNDLFADTTLKGVELIAYVGGIEDQSGNVQEYPANWTFQVNVSPVFWDPEVLDRAAYSGTFPVISSTLKNTASISKSFSISSYPAWLTPEILEGTVLPNGEYEIKFAVDPSLAPGIYSGTVTATVDNLALNLAVSFKMLAKSPNWVVNPADYDYSMTVVAQFSLDNGNTQLASDPRDLIAAFVNGQPRGVGNMQYVADINQYVAFITIYSDNNGGGNGETVSFRFWHALNGIEYGAVETTPFINDATVGSLTSPFILHPDGIVQVIPLKKGWNWISLNVANSDMSCENLLESITSEDVGNDILIKRKDGKKREYENSKSKWKGNLSSMDTNQGYMIWLSEQPDTLRVVGTPITPGTISANSGWNWIGYHPQTLKPLPVALSSLSPSTQDIIKSQTEFAEYYAATSSWIGSLGFMQPGMGYKLKLGTADNLTYTARTGSDVYQLTHEVFESNMTVVATIAFEGKTRVAEARFVVGAFIEGECRGSGTLEFDEDYQQYRIYLPIHGNVDDQGKKIVFKIYDYEEDLEIISDGDPQLFLVDKILGRAANPYVLFENLAINGGYALGQNQPNPYTSGTAIHYLIPTQETVTISLIDQLGRVVKVLVNEEKQAGEHLFKFDGKDLAAGVYFYRLEAGEFSATRKMIKTN